MDFLSKCGRYVAIDAHLKTSRLSHTQLELNFIQTFAPVDNLLLFVCLFVCFLACLSVCLCVLVRAPSKYLSVRTGCGSATTASGERHFGTEWGRNGDRNGNGREWARRTAGNWGKQKSGNWRRSRGARGTKSDGQRERESERERERDLEESTQKWTLSEVIQWAHSNQFAPEATLLWPVGARSPSPLGAGHCHMASKFLAARRCVLRQTERQRERERDINWPLLHGRQWSNDWAQLQC